MTSDEIQVQEDEEQELANKVLQILHQGTTCYHHMTAEYITGGYILIHHKSHGAWVGRMTGLQTCQSYHHLVKAEDVIRQGNRNGHMYWAERESLLYFEKRMNKNRMDIIYNLINRRESLLPMAE